MNIGDIAAQLYVDEFEGTSGAPTLSAISGWLSGNVGVLNALIYTDLEYDSDYPQEEAVIFKTIYLRDFYSKEAGKALRGIVNGAASNLLLQLREGDSEIRFANRNEISKTLSSVSSTYAQQLSDLVNAYRIYNAFPRQVAGNDATYPENSYETFDVSDRDVD